MVVGSLGKGLRKKSYGSLGIYAMHETYCLISYIVYLLNTLAGTLKTPPENKV